MSTFYSLINRDMVGFTFEDGKLLDQRTESIISDMERERMRRLDELIGTQTHFHEIAPYEERLDSQTVLERSIFKGQKYVHSI